MRFPAYHLPRGARNVPKRTRSFGSHAAETALLSAAALEQELRAADDAARRLRQRPVAAILAALAATAAAWSDLGNPPLDTAVEILADGTGFSVPVVRRGIAATIDALRDDAIGARLDHELGARSNLDSGTVRGPRRITHVLSGNLPGLSFAPISLSLALKSAVLVKSAAGDPFSPTAFAATIAAVDPELGRCIVVHDWRGGDAELESVAFAADVVVAAGSDAAIEAIAARTQTRFFGHGHKISFALVGREALADATAVAARLAFDVALWDQHGCLSPQICFVENDGAGSVDEFAQTLAAALERAGVELPPRRLGFADKAAIAVFRQQAQWQASTPADRLLAAPDTGWTIAVEHAPSFRPTCLNRCIRVVAIDDAASVASLIAPHRRHLECAGLACATARHAALATMLLAAGVHRVCALGTMQTPTLDWQQGGRPRVRDWLEWDGADG